MCRSAEIMVNFKFFVKSKKSKTECFEKRSLEILCHVFFLLNDRNDFLGPSLSVTARTKRRVQKKNLNVGKLIKTGSKKAHSGTKEQPEEHLLSYRGNLYRRSWLTEVLTSDKTKFSECTGNKASTDASPRIKKKRTSKSILISFFGNQGCYRKIQKS